MKWFKIREKGVGGWSFFSLTIRSANDENYYDYGKHNVLHFSIMGRYWYISIPQIVRPKMKWVDTSHYEWAKPNPDGTKGYWHVIVRSYGIDFSTDSLHVHYGIQPGEWHSNDRKNSDHTKVFFYPWKLKTRVRYSFYKPDGTHQHTLYEKNHRIDFKAIQLAEKLVPKIRFRFKDFDGEEIEATCYITEMEWHQGTGICKWLRYFIKPLVVRSLDIRFDKEVGYEKGSWKGGTLGHSIEMMVDETAAQAFRRYGRSYDRYRNHGHKNRMFSDIEVIS